MSFNLRNRSFLTLRDFTPGEIGFLLKLARELKAAKLSGTEQPHLKRKNIALIFEKSSTRTRVGFEVAAYDQGAHVTYLGPSGTQIGHKESMKDTARVLGRVYDAIEYRGFAQKTVEELARHSGVPVYNGLTDEFHPTQILADLGMDVRLCGPKANWPDPAIVADARAVAAKTGARVSLSEDIEASVKGVDFVYTDVWLSMGEPEEAWAERIRTMLPYQVNAGVMAMTGKPKAKFMHCLPAIHSDETEVAQQIKGRFGVSEMEATNDVFESEASIVFDKAENRMHTIKAVLVATIGT